MVWLLLLLLLAPTRADPAYSIAGVAPGMSRKDVEERWGAWAADTAPKVRYRKTPTGVVAETPETNVYYDEHDVVRAVMGKTLLSGDRPIVEPDSKAGAVRAVLGPPSRTSQGHVVLTVGGFFWEYDLAPGLVARFSFVDDSFSLGDEAPLFQIFLLRPHN